MFLKVTRGATRNGEWANGPFLALFSAPDCKFERTSEVRGFVRSVRLTQMGHWMMGEMYIRTLLGDSVRVGLSGTYGSDGLTTTALDSYWASLWPLPEELAYLHWTDNGHNSAGSNGKYIHKWACQHEKALKQPRPAGMPEPRKYRLQWTGTFWAIICTALQSSDWTRAETVATYPVEQWADASRRLALLRSWQEPTEALRLFRAGEKVRKGQVK